MRIRQLSEQEFKAVTKIGNKVFDVLVDLGLSEKRAQYMAEKAEQAVTKELEAGE